MSETIRLHVKLFATLNRYAPLRGELPGTPFDLNLSGGATLADLVKRLGLPAGEVKVAFVNGRIQPMDTILKDGDEVGIFPPVGGG